MANYRHEIAGYQMDTGTIIITEDDDDQRPPRVAIYARVSSSENKSNLTEELKRDDNAVG